MANHFRYEMTSLGHKGMQQDVIADQLDWTRGAVNIGSVPVWHIEGSLEDHTLPRPCLVQ